MWCRMFPTRNLWWWSGVLQYCRWLELMLVIMGLRGDPSLGVHICMEWLPLGKVCGKKLDQLLNKAFFLTGLKTHRRDARVTDLHMNSTVYKLKTPHQSVWAEKAFWMESETPSTINKPNYLSSHTTAGSLFGQLVFQGFHVKKLKCWTWACSTGSGSSYNPFI